MFSKNFQQFTSKLLYTYACCTLSQVHCATQCSSHMTDGAICNAYYLPRNNTAVTCTCVSRNLSCMPLERQALSSSTCKPSFTAFLLEVCTHHIFSLATCNTLRECSNIILVSQRSIQYIEGWLSGKYSKQNPTLKNLQYPLFCQNKFRLACFSSCSPFPVETKVKRIKCHKCQVHNVIHHGITATRTVTLFVFFSLSKYLTVVATNITINNLRVILTLSIRTTVKYMKQFEVNINHLGPVVRTKSK